jgi:hypothetical protein
VVRDSHCFTFAGRTMRRNVEPGIKRVRDREAEEPRRMLLPFSVWLAVGTVSCLILGAISVVAAIRVPEGCGQQWFQRLFVACLVGLAACTLSALGDQDFLWLCGGAAFAGLAVAATLDLRPTAVEAL